MSVHHIKEFNSCQLLLLQCLKELTGTANFNYLDRSPLGIFPVSYQACPTLVADERLVRAVLANMSQMYRIRSPEGFSSYPPSMLAYTQISHSGLKYENRFELKVSSNYSDRTTSPHFPIQGPRIVIVCFYSSK